MAKQLVRSLLSIEPCDRISASEALQHPWIKCYAQPDPSHTFPLSKGN
jgi:serine/threonine protein kinase